MTRLADLGEEKVISELMSVLSDLLPRNTRLSPMDDAHAVLNDIYALKIDGYSLSRSLYPWEKPWRWGWRAVTGVVSDLSAKGYSTLGIAYSLGLRPRDRLEWVLGIAEGVRKALVEYKALFLGGDLNSTSSDPWIDVAGIGKLEARAPLPRRITDPKPSGELDVYTTLRNGYGPPGLIAHYHYRLGREPSEKLKDYLPRAIVEFPRIASETEVLASIDVSDGLARALWQLARANKLTIRIEELPLGDDLMEEAKVLGLDPAEAVLYGGEEYEIVFLAHRDYEMSVLEACRRAGVRCSKIGTAINGEARLTYKGRLVAEKGWDQFAINDEGKA